jgi:hypothetical protein
MTVDTAVPSCDTAASSIVTMAQRGGYREGSGRRSIFPGTMDNPTKYPMDFTKEGLQILDDVQSHTGLTRNNIIAHLVDRHAHELEFDHDRIVYPGKAQHVLAIRMPKHIGDKLVAAQKRTGKAFSDLGEALVRRFGAKEVFPVLESKQKTRRRRRRRARR